MECKQCDERKCTKCQSPLGPDSNGDCIPCTSLQYWEDGICKDLVEGYINQISSDECIDCDENEYFLLNKKCVKKSHQEECLKETTSSNH